MPTIRPLFFFFFNDTATTEIYTLSLHDALPISALGSLVGGARNIRDQTRYGRNVNQMTRPRLAHARQHRAGDVVGAVSLDRKSTRLNSSHANISYAVFCLKKKKHAPAAS